MENGHPFVTTDYVLDESYTTIRKNAGHHVAVKFGEDLRASSSVEVRYVTPEIIEEAWKIFKKYSDHRFSFTDCVSFTLMKQMRIETAFTFDSDFRTFGFILKPNRGTGS